MPPADQADDQQPSDAHLALLTLKPSGRIPGEFFCWPWGVEELGYELDSVETAVHEAPDYNEVDDAPGGTIRGASASDVRPEGHDVSEATAQSTGARDFHAWHFSKFLDVSNARREKYQATLDTPYASMYTALLYAGVRRSLPPSHDSILVVKAPELGPPSALLFYDSENPRNGFGQLYILESSRPFVPGADDIPLESLLHLSIVMKLSQRLQNGLSVLPELAIKNGATLRDLARNPEYQTYRNDALSKEPLPLLIRKPTRSDDALFSERQFRYKEVTGPSRSELEDGKWDAKGFVAKRMADTWKEKNSRSSLNLLWD